MKKIKIWPFYAFFRDFWPLMTFFDPGINFFWEVFTKSFILKCNLCTFGDVRNLTPYAPKCPRMTSVLFFKLLKNIWTKLSLLNLNWEKHNHFLKNKANVLLWGVIFHFRGQISKNVSGQFEEHQKSGRQPNISLKPKTTADRGCVAP